MTVVSCWHRCVQSMIELTLVFMFFTLILAITFLLLILANCVSDESCREKLAPISPNGSIIQVAAVSPAHRFLIKAQIN